jgi:hypothetical protein
MTTAQHGLARTVFGPHQSRGEILITTTGTATVIALLAAYIDRAGGWGDWSALQKLAVAAIIFDLIFGMFTISTPTAKRWYHRPGRAALGFRCAFVLGHLLYLAAVAALFGPGPAWAMVNASLLLGAAIIVEFAARDLKRLVAIGLTTAATLANFVWLPTPDALAWLPALLFAKILLCFLLPESD